MSNDLLRDLLIAERLATGNSPNAARLYRDARREIERCHERLEIDHYFKADSDNPDKFERVEVPYVDRLLMADGVEARDETIKLLEE